MNCDQKEESVPPLTNQTVVTKGACCFWIHHEHLVAFCRVKTANDVFQHEFEGKIATINDLFSEIYKLNQSQEIVGLAVPIPIKITNLTIEEYKSQNKVALVLLKMFGILNSVDIDLPS